MSAHGNPAGAGTPERRSRYRRGLFSETIAAAFLLAKGYRILARRFRSNAGEIDLIAFRGRTVAFVEVKRRLTDEAAESSITPHQRRRVRGAADAWMARNSRYRECDRRFDVIFVLPRRWPRHIPGGL